MSVSCYHMLTREPLYLVVTPSPFPNNKTLKLVIDVHGQLLEDSPFRTLFFDFLVITKRTCKALALLVGNVDCYTVVIWKQRVELVNVAFSAVTSCSSLKQSHNYDKSCRAIALTTPRVKSHVPGAMHHWQLSVSGLSCWPWHRKLADRHVVLLCCMLVKRHTISNQWIMWPKPSMDFSLIRRGHLPLDFEPGYGAILSPVLSSSCIPMSWCGHCVQNKILKIWNVVYSRIHHWVAWHIIEYQRISVWILECHEQSIPITSWLTSEWPRSLATCQFPISPSQNRDENPWPSGT